MKNSLSLPVKMFFLGFLLVGLVTLGSAWGEENYHERWHGGQKVEREAPQAGEAAPDAVEKGMKGQGQTMGADESDRLMEGKWGKKWMKKGMMNCPMMMPENPKAASPEMLKERAKRLREMAQEMEAMAKKLESGNVTQKEWNEFRTKCRCPMHQKMQRRWH